MTDMAKRILHTLMGTILVALAMVIVGPLTYDEAAHRALDQATRHWAHWGDQLVGIDVTAPRQNIFSLARDLDRVITVKDHGTVLSSHTMGLANFISRGTIHSVVDALRWFNVPLTYAQAHKVQLCGELDDIREGQPIVVESDPYQRGLASWYGPGFHGRLAASGEIYNMYDLTAAHKTLPLGSLVRVVASRTDRTIVVRINDRGPYVPGRIIDMSHRAKEGLGMGDLASVYIERLDPSALEVWCE